MNKSAKGSEASRVENPNRWDFTHRQLEPELMDDPAIAAEEHDAALRGLRRLNALSDSAGVVWGPIRRLARQQAEQPLRVLDLATGAGDVPLALHRRAKRAGLNLELAGCDLSEQALDFARKTAQQKQANVQWFQHDAPAGELPPDYDVVICCLFLHHLQDQQAVELLRKMAAAAKQLVIVNDIERSRLGWLLVQIGARLVTRSHVVHTDASLSIRAAFTLPEVRELAREAGLETASISRYFPCRYRLIWSRV